MIVCVCKAVSERAIRTASQAGARTMEAIAAATGAGAECGCCRDAISKVLAEPCKPVPCAGCPRRAAANEAVPARIAAQQLETP